jgi:lysyl-tRNA synthetase class 1
VAIEDDISATRLSSVEDRSKRPGAVGVTFRHLAMLAQIRSSDEEVWNMIPNEGVDRKEFDARVNRMRHWISSHHFPDEMRVGIRDKPNAERLANLTPEEEALRMALIRNFEASLENGWNEANLSANVPDAAREVELPLRESYRLTYELLLGVDVAPKLAPLLAAMEPQRVLHLMRGE